MHTRSIKMFLAISMIAALFGYTSVLAQERTSDGTVTETLNCSMIRVSELLYVLENSDRGQNNQKVRSWIAAKVTFQLKMMESVKLDSKQREFVQNARKRLLAQQ